MDSNQVKPSKRLPLRRVGGRNTFGLPVIAELATGCFPHRHRCTIINIRGDSHHLKEKRKANKSTCLTPADQEMKS
jgi:hypothetical protein